MQNDTPTALGALRVDEEKLRGHVDEVVRSSVEETLNALLDAEADQICRAQGAALRALARTGRPASGALRAHAGDQGRRGAAEGPEAAHNALRDGDN
jgi:hypothetical protein